LKKKDIFFLGKRIITLSPAAHIKLNIAGHVVSHHFSLLPSHLSCYSATWCTVPAPHSMAKEFNSNPPPTNSSIDNDVGSDSGAESTTMTTSSSPTHGASLMAKGEISELMDFFKRTTITEEELQAFHNRGWLTGNMISTVPEVDVSTVHGLTILCFESHLLAGLGLAPSKFLAAIMNYLGCSLVHFNTNVLVALNGFVMLCECWLGTSPYSSLF
jgi:hypothetical protein